jgi:hypothetical protein
MLTPLDETLRHQLPTTFDHAGTSDPRFFDRYWFAVYDPAGTEPVLNTGMCSYLNMNVVDGYASMVADSRQHNVRFSRSLRPELYGADPFVSTLGALEVSVLEPFRRLRLRLGPNDSPMQFDLEWCADLAPHEELPNFARQRGRVTADFVRYNQSGTANGWIVVDGVRREVRDWWGGRDHSWGVRTDVAGGEPVTGDDSDRPARSGFLWTWLTFGSRTWAGHVQLHEIPDGTAVHSEALLRWADGSEIRTGRIELDFDVVPGTRRFSTATWRLRTPGGTWQIDAVPFSRPFAMQGMGYSMGYLDRRGFGVWRGESHVEHDVYDVRDAEEVRFPDGTVDRPYHRDCAVQLRLRAPDGSTTEGTGHCAILPHGSLPQRGLT